MTLTMAWIRSVKNTEELLIASDSRLRWGQAWDACPKIFRTRRGDAVFAFAGDTMYSYPLILQAINHIELHKASRERVSDIYKLKGHLSRVFQSMLLDINDFPLGDNSYEAPESLLILAGYSWRNRSFDIWKVRYDKTLMKFVWERPGGLKAAGGNNRLVVIGHPSMSDKDRATVLRSGKQPDISRDNDVKVIASSRIARLVKKRGGLQGRGLDMEPFEVLRDMLREKVSPHIGGAPQLVKIYPSCTSQTIGVLWPNKASETVAVLGRRLLKYERLDCSVLDPDSLDIGLHLWPSTAVNSVGGDPSLEINGPDATDTVL